MSKEVEETTARTQEAIQRILDAKLHGDSKKQNGDTLIQYTPTKSIAGGPHKQRVIKIVDKQQDPMLPPSFKIRKVPEGPKDDAPIPILHEEANAKVTKEDQKKWSIPPAVSNWKNNKGFTISIDKRLASIGTQPDATEMSSRFGTLSEALEQANKQAREDLQIRAKLRREAEREKLLESQRNLQKIARDARQSGRRQGRLESSASDREHSRRDRHKKAERELRMQKTNGERRIKMLAKDQSREVSDRVALGVASSTKSTAAVYDSKLFLKAAGTNTRHSEDQVYDSALFGASDAINDIYRARDSQNFKGLGSDKQLKKLEGEQRFEGLSSGPVAFEKESKTESSTKIGLQSSKKRQWEE